MSAKAKPGSGQTEKPGDKRHVIKPTVGNLNKLRQGLDVAEALYGDLLTDWRRIDAASREQILVHSPQLARLLALAGRGIGGA